MIRRLALGALVALWPALASAQVAFIAPTAPNTDNGNRIATTAWVNNFFAAGLPLATGKIWIGSAGGIATPQAIATVATSGSASDLSTGTLQAAQEPAHTGDMTNVAGSLATTVTKINGVDQTTAWTTYTPTVTASSGTFTTVSATGRFKQIGKTIIVQADVSITAAGSAAGLLRATLPFTAAAFNYPGVAKERLLTGKSGVAEVSANGTFMFAADSGALTFIANGAEVIFGITYEVP